MMTIEVLVRKGTTTAAQRAALGRALLTGLITEDGAPDAVLDKARALTNVLVHEPDVWVTADDAPRYLVRVVVPGSWHSKDFGAYMIPRITEVLERSLRSEHRDRATEPDPGRLYREPHCQVQIIGLKEHALGTLGRVTTATDITRLITDDYRTSGDQREAAPGTAIDPVCGMTVDLATATITLDHDGTRYAFCAPVCKKVFSEELAG